MTNKYSTLYVIGDSFSVPPKPEDTTVTWPQQVARGLKEQLGHDVVLENLSLMGCAQDYCWDILQQLLEHRITENDYIVIALTHPSRFWFLDRLPEMTNSNIIDLDSFVTYAIFNELDWISYTSTIAWAILPIRC